MHGQSVSLIAVMVVCCALCQWVAWRISVPAILLLLITGITAGPILGIVQPDQLLGDLLFPFVSLSVAIILFEGSLTLRFRDIKDLHHVVRNLVSLGMLVTWLVTALATKYLIGTTNEVAALFGAIMVVTGPTVIAPILRTVRPVSSLANILKWESIVIDPIGASLAVLVFEFIISGGGQEALGHTLLTFGQLVIIGAAIGALVGSLFGSCLRYHLIPEFLHNIVALALVIGSFALADYLQPESGLVTVTVFGIWLANMKNVDLEHILAFKETLSILLISLLFIILAARLDFSTLHQLGWGAVILCIVIILVARPLNIAISTFGSGLSFRQRCFLAFIAPRGIVAAAISSLFALRLEAYSYNEAALIVPLTFLVIMVTVLLQSIAAVPLARVLGVSQPKPDGVLIIGGNKVARLLGQALIEQNITVVVVDSSVENIAQIRQQNIPCCYGNPLSEQTVANLDLSGFGTLLAVSEQEAENISAGFHFRSEFGKNNIYLLPTVPGGSHCANDRSRARLPGKTLFSETISYPELITCLEDGGRLAESAFDGQHHLLGLHLFAIDNRGALHFACKEQPLRPEKGWKIVRLVTPQGEQQTKTEPGHAID